MLYWVVFNCLNTFPALFEGQTSPFLKMLKYHSNVLPSEKLLVQFSVDDVIPELSYTKKKTCIFSLKKNGCDNTARLAEYFQKVKCVFWFSGGKKAPAAQCRLFKKVE